MAGFAGWDTLKDVDFVVLMCNSDPFSAEAPPPPAPLRQYSVQG